jgi:DUF971 family protein
MSGESLVHEADVPGDVKLVEARPVGRYGLNLVFSDRHATGIYTFESLRKLGRTV